MKLAVYCSSRQGLEQEYFDLAAALGRWIGSQGHTLVYGGVNAGLMHAVAQACHDAGGHIVGVNVETFRHRTDPLVDEVVYTADLGEDEMSRSPFARDKHLHRYVVVANQQELIEKLNQL